MRLNDYGLSLPLLLHTREKDDYPLSVTLAKRQHSSAFTRPFFFWLSLRPSRGAREFALQTCVPPTSAATQQKADVWAPEFSEAIKKGDARDLNRTCHHPVSRLRRAFTLMYRNRTLSVLGCTRNAYIVRTSETLSN